MTIKNQTTIMANQINFNCANEIRISERKRSIGAIYDNRWVVINSETIDMEATTTVIPKGANRSELFVHKSTADGIYTNATLQICAPKGCKPYARIISYESFISEAQHMNTVCAIENNGLIHLPNRKIWTWEKDWEKIIQSLHWQDWTPMNAFELHHSNTPNEFGRLHNGRTKEEALAFLMQKRAAYLQNESRKAQLLADKEANLKTQAATFASLLSQAPSFSQGAEYLVQYDETEMFVVMTKDDDYWDSSVETKSKSQTAYLSQYGALLPVIFATESAVSHSDISTNLDATRIAVAYPITHEQYAKCSDGVLINWHGKPYYAKVFDINQKITK